MTLPKRLRRNPCVIECLKELDAQGRTGTFSFTRGDHVRLSVEDGPTVFMPNSTSDHRAALNVKSQLRRALSEHETRRAGA